MSPEKGAPLEEKDLEARIQAMFLVIEKSHPHMVGNSGLRNGIESALRSPQGDPRTRLVVPDDNPQEFAEEERNRSPELRSLGIHLDIGDFEGGVEELLLWIETFHALEKSRSLELAIFGHSVSPSEVARLQAVGAQYYDLADPENKPFLEKSQRARELDRRRIAQSLDPMSNGPTPCS